jgi:hypothetical protein
LVISVQQIVQLLGTAIRRLRKQHRQSLLPPLIKLGLGKAIRHDAGEFGLRRGNPEIVHLPAIFQNFFAGEERAIRQAIIVAHVQL